MLSSFLCTHHAQRDEYVGAILPRRGVLPARQTARNRPQIPFYAVSPHIVATSARLRVVWHKLCIMPVVTNLRGSKDQQAERTVSHVGEGTLRSVVRFYPAPRIERCDARRPFPGIVKPRSACAELVRRDASLHASVPYCSDREVHPSSEPAALARLTTEKNHVATHPRRNGNVSAEDRQDSAAGPRPRSGDRGKGLPARAARSSPGFWPTTTRSASCWPRPARPPNTSCASITSSTCKGSMRPHGKRPTIASTRA